MSEQHPVGNRATRRAWSKIVRDSRDTFYELPVTDDETFKVLVPDVDRLSLFYKTRQQGDLYESLAVILGNDDAELGQQRVQRLREIATDAAVAHAREQGEENPDPEKVRVPISAWRDLMEEVMNGLGLGQGERAPGR